MDAVVPLGKNVGMDFIFPHKANLLSAGDRNASSSLPASRSDRSHLLLKLDGDRQSGAMRSPCPTASFEGENWWEMQLCWSKRDIPRRSSPV